MYAFHRCKTRCGHKLAFASPPWCKVVKTRRKARHMNRKKSDGAKTQSTPLVRASISFPPDLYETLEALAKQKKVSLAWVVRDASERYIADQQEKTTGKAR